MKNLFKCIIIGLLLFSFVESGQAQQLNFGIKAGANISTMTGFEKVASLVENANVVPFYPWDYSTGYVALPHIGLMMQYTFPCRVFLQPELSFSMQGVKEVSSDGTEKTWMSFLKLPVYAGYKIKVGAQTGVVVGVGPYVAYGLAGSDGTYGDEGILRRWDVGASAMAGIQHKNIQITGGYDLGLIEQIGLDEWDEAKRVLDFSKICNRNIKISVGLFF